MPKFEDIRSGDALPSRDHTAGIVQLFMYNAEIGRAHV